jgi:hypothetical protein
VRPTIGGISRDVSFTRDAESSIEWVEHFITQARREPGEQNARRLHEMVRASFGITTSFTERQAQQDLAVHVVDTHGSAS